MSDKNVFDEYEPENPFDKLLKKSKDNPLVPLGNINSMFLFFEIPF